jgi:quercetin dioxygenase-like cupin family protein
MAIMSPQHRAHLRHQGEVEGQAVDGGLLQTLVDQSVGARHLTAYRLTIAAGAAVNNMHPAAEEALYVLEGAGTIQIEAARYALGPGQAAFVPAGAEHHYINTGDRPLILVGAMASTGSSSPKREAIETPMIDERRVAPTLMGERSFRVLISPHVGCWTMTQFTGVIPTGRAPLHAHPHEEVVYILAGSGQLWIDTAAVGALRPGSVVFFPIGVRHTLENTGRDDMKVLGAFSPAGSPDAKLPTAG